MTDNSAPARPVQRRVLIQRSTEGDWVRVTADGKFLDEGHSLGVRGAVALLKALGMPVAQMLMRPGETGYEPPQTVPRDAEGMAPVVFESSEEGDWVRVSQDGLTIEEGHSLGNCHVAAILRHVGFSVEEREVPGEEFL